VSPTRHRTALLGVLALAAAVTGCASGRTPEVLKERTSINGTNAETPDGSVFVRNFYATPGTPGADRVTQGQTLDLHFVLFNEGTTPDTLTGITETTGAAATLSTGAGGFRLDPSRHVTVGAGTAGAPRATLTASQARFVGENLSVTLLFADATSLRVTIPVERAG
jgi:hypothetical protein